MKRNKLIRQILVHFIIIHIIVSLVFVLGTNYVHPFFNAFKNFPTFVQVSLLGLVDVIYYFIIAFIYAKFYDDKESLYIIVGWVVIVFALIFMAVYALVYFASMTFYSRDIMLIYSIINPWYGSFMQKLSDEKLYSLWWMVSTVTPMIGLYLGVKAELKSGVSS